MVKNTKGGKHHKKQKKGKAPQEQGYIVYAEDNQVYASVTKRVGGSRIRVTCSDTKERSGLIPGKFFKKVWFNDGDVLLCELNPFDDSQCYILRKYTYKDANLLKSQGKITFEINDKDEGNEDGDNTGYGFADAETETDNGDKGNSKILDIKNIKENNTKKEKEKEEDLDVAINNNHVNQIKSSKWSSKEKDTKVYTLDDL